MLLGEGEREFVPLQDLCDSAHCAGRGNGRCACTQAHCFRIVRGVLLLLLLLLCMFLNKRQACFI